MYRSWLCLCSACRQLLGCWPRAQQRVCPHIHPAHLKSSRCTLPWPTARCCAECGVLPHRACAQNSARTTRWASWPSGVTVRTYGVWVCVQPRVVKKLCGEKTCLSLFVWAILVHACDHMYTPNSAKIVCDEHLAISCSWAVFTQISPHAPTP